MDYIEKRKNDNTGEIEYEVGISYQDGTERSVFTEEDKAIKSYRLGVKFSRGEIGLEDPDPQGLTIPVHIIDRTKWPEILVKKTGRLDWNNDLIGQAIQLVLDESLRLRCGERYQLRITLTKVEDTFIGDGI